MSRTKSLETCFLSKIFTWKKFVKKFTKSWKLKKSISNAFSNISWTSWATETYLTFLERIFHNKQLCKSLKSSKTIFYSRYCLKYQFGFFRTSLYVSKVNLRRYESPRKVVTSCTYFKNPKTIPIIAWAKAPMLYTSLGPIFTLNFPKIVENMKAAKLAVPNTEPYWLEVAPLSSASLG